MTKKKMSSKKNNRNQVKRNIEKKESGFEKEIYKVLCIMFGVLLFLAVFYFITVAIVSDKEETKDDEETAIQYEQILAGSSFNMKDDEYLVVYYDFSDEELAELTSVVYNYSYSLDSILYKVDMSDGFNKKYIAEDESNKNPESSSDLKINGPTLIKIIDKKCVEYIEGNDKIIEYLS